MKAIIVHIVINVPNPTATLPRVFTSIFRNKLEDNRVLLFISNIPEMIIDIGKMANNKTNALNFMSFSGNMICKTTTTKIAAAIVGGKK